MRNEKQVFRIHIDATLQPGSDKVENHVEVEMQCTGDLAITALVDVMKQDKDIKHVMFEAVKHLIMIERTQSSGKSGEINLGISNTSNGVKKD